MDIFEFLLKNEGGWALDNVIVSINWDIVVHNKTIICTINRSVHKDPKLKRKGRRVSLVLRSYI